MALIDVSNGCATATWRVGNAEIQIKVAPLADGVIRVGLPSVALKREQWDEFKAIVDRLFDASAQSGRG